MDDRQTRPDGVPFFDTAEEALAAAAPEGACVRAVGFDVTDGILRAGYRVTEGDADIVIARGGEREFAAARAACPDAKLILCPTHAYPAAATARYRTTDGAFALMADGKKPFAAVFCANDTHANLASTFGEIVSLELCAFDCCFGAMMRGDVPDDNAASAVASLTAKLTAELKPCCKDRKRAAAILVRAGRRAARIVERRPELLHFSGAAQTAEAVRMLYCAEDRPLGMRGETEMLLSVFVADLYVKNLDGRPTDFPPDYNRRIDSICEYFKTDVRRAVAYASAVYPPLKMRVCEYRRDEFKAELSKRLSGVRRRLADAWQVFKRLYPDDGYGLKTLVDREDLGLCVALAPDVFASDSMLSFLKQTGRLDKYII